MTHARLSWTINVVNHAHILPDRERLWRPDRSGSSVRYAPQDIEQLAYGLVWIGGRFSDSRFAAEEQATLDPVAPIGRETQASRLGVFEWERATRETEPGLAREWVELAE